MAASAPTEGHGLSAIYSMPGGALGALLLALGVALAWGGWSHVRARREGSRVDDLARQLRLAAPGQRVKTESSDPGLSTLALGINHLLTRTALAEQEAALLAPQLLAELGDRVHEAVLVHRDVILYANRQFARLAGLERDSLRGRRLAELLPPDSAALVNETLHRLLAGRPAPQRFELDLLAPQGPPTRLEISTAVIAYAEDSAVLITGVEVIPTQVVPALASAAPARSLHRAMVDALAEAVLFTDVTGLITYANPAAEELLGSAAEQLLGKTLETVVSVVDETDQRLLLDPVRQALASGTTVTLARRALLLSRPDGSERAVELSAAPARPDGTLVAGVVVLLHDVTELTGVARQLSYQATHDTLTGLVNRRELERRLQEALERAQRGEGTHLLCYLDLDHFRVVNDTSGSHVAGDGVLREVAKLLRAAVRDSDTIARLGGDEFGMLLPGCPLTKGLQIATDLCRDLARYRFAWRDRIFNLGVSIGVLEISRESGSAEEALQAADAACYIAKRRGAGQVVVYSARDEALARHSGEIQWLTRLQSALAEERFSLHQEPILTLGEEAWQGPAVEVRVRMKDESGRELPAAELERLAARYRLMGRIDRWVVDTTLQAVARGALALPAGRSAALRVSEQTLADAQFLTHVVECLDRTGVAPGQVCFVLTESAVTAHLSLARRFVSVLHGMGCQFALEGFGAESGSFASLRGLPLSYVKIDSDLIRKLTRDPVNPTLVASLIKLARSLGFKVIAGDVEDREVLELARSLGVDGVQGLAVGPPQPLPLPPAQGGGPADSDAAPPVGADDNS